MGNKGDQTKQMILMEAKQLFANKGFTEVTMKDICEKTGLSRGGLYRHYGNTDQIFEAMFVGLSDESRDNMEEKIGQGMAAEQILTEEFLKLEEEMMDQESSLSLAIYEYAVNRNSQFFNELNHLGRKKWEKLLQYGIRRGEFQEVNPEPIIDLIVYSYQGIRMWNRIVTMNQQQVHVMLRKISEMIVKQDRIE